MSEKAIVHFLSQFKSPHPSRGTGWLDRQRESALEVLKDTGFPTRRVEDWRYTDISPILKRGFDFTRPVSTGVSTVDLSAARIAGLDCHEMVFINGIYSKDLSNLSGLAGKVEVKSLIAAINDNDPWVEEHLNRRVNTGRNGFIALNTAFIEDGAAIRIPDNTELEKPLCLIYLSDPDKETSGSNIRNLLVLGKNARACVIETWSGADDNEYFNNTVTEVTLDTGATLEHYKIQQEGIKAFHIGHMEVHQEKDSHLISHQVSLGGILSRSDLDVSLDGPGSECRLNGLYMAGKSQHVDHHTRIDHVSPHTGSNETYRGVLDGRAHGVFNGKIFVHKGAQKTDARLANANLLLTSDAEVDTKPELEIYADDVKCSHGATVGRLDDQMMYYLRTRAIEKEVARSLLTYAFAGEVIRHMSLLPVRNRLEQIIAGRLPDAVLIKEFIK